MKKEEYLKKLEYLLIDMPTEDLMQIEDFYEELILDGVEQGYTEEEILDKFETPEEVADKIRAEYGGLVVYTAKAKSKEEKQGYTSSEMIHTVQVETENRKIRVKAVEEGPVRVYFKSEDDLDRVEFEEKDGVFLFRHRRKKTLNIKSWLNFLFDFNLVILEIPVNFAGKLYIRTTNGTVRIDGLANLSSGEICTNNGKIRIENSRAEDLRISSNNGMIELANLIGEELEVSAANGLISAKECRFPRRLSLGTQNGAVTGRNIISDEIIMQSSNGFVTGTVIGNQNDYNINSTTRNGFNNLDNINDPNRTRSLTARTHNGRIQIDFTL